MSEIGRVLVIVGVVLILTGLLFLALGKVPGVGRLPGDILVKRDNFTFYFPLTTCLLVSVLMTLFFMFLSRR